MPNYPGSLDTLTNPTASDTLASPAHSTQHANANDIVEALEAKVGIGASTPTTTGHVLTVTGAGASAWQAAADGGNYALSAGKMAAGHHLRPNVTQLTGAASATVTANQLYGVPLAIGFSQTWVGISLHVITSAAGGARLGIYAESASVNGAPGALVVDAGTVDTGTTGTKTIVINQTLSPGVYWLAVVFNATPAVRVVAVATARVLLGTPTFNGTDRTSLSRGTFTYGPLPATFSHDMAEAGAPILLGLEAQ